jgi:hypothetical protein
VADTNDLIDERKLLNLTCNELDEDADANGDGFVNDADWAVQTALSGPSLRRFRPLVFTESLISRGDCSDDPVDHTGEQVMSQPTVFFKNVYFTTLSTDVQRPVQSSWECFHLRIGLLFRQIDIQLQYRQ